MKDTRFFVTVGTALTVGAIVAMLALILWLARAPDPQTGDRLPGPPISIPPSTFEVLGTGVYTITGTDGQAVLTGPLTIEESQ